MAAETTEITESNQDMLTGYQQHVLADLHQALQLLRDQGQLIEKHDRLLEEFRPLLETFRHPAASLLAARRARRTNG
jgi:hypothetical protein